MSINCGGKLGSMDDGKITLRCPGGQTASTREWLCNNWKHILNKYFITSRHTQASYINKQLERCHWSLTMFPIIYIITDSLNEHEFNIITIQLKKQTLGVCTSFNEIFQAKFSLYQYHPRTINQSIRIYHRPIKCTDSYTYYDELKHQ